MGLLCCMATTLLPCRSDHRTGRLALVFELMDWNIYELIRGRGVHLAEGLVRLYMWQLLQALDHMHRSGIFHRCACSSCRCGGGALSAPKR